MPVGNHAIYWDGRTNAGLMMASSSSQYQFRADGFSSMRPMILKRRLYDISVDLRLLEQLFWQVFHSCRRANISKDQSIHTVHFDF